MSVSAQNATGHPTSEPVFIARGLRKVYVMGEVNGTRVQPRGAHSLP